MLWDFVSFPALHGIKQNWGFSFSYGEFAGSYEWYRFLRSNEWDIQSSWGGPERYSYTGEISAGLLHKHSKEIERPQSTIKTKRLLHLKKHHYVTVNEAIYVFKHKFYVWQNVWIGNAIHIPQLHPHSFLYSTFSVFSFGQNWPVKNYSILKGISFWNYCALSLNVC